MTITRPHPSHFGTSGKPKPGEFKANCRLGAHRDQGFETAALFEAHMLEHHGAKPGMCAKRTLRRVNGRDVFSPIEGFTSLRLAKKPKAWRAPRLTEAGKPFEPAGLQPGATVTWRELAGTGEFYDTAHGGRTERREWIERSGQVWSDGWRPRSVWVVPFELLPGEQAVLLEERSSLLGVHTNACRGDLRCWPTGAAARRLYSNGWWRR